MPKNVLYNIFGAILAIFADSHKFSSFLQKEHLNIKCKPTYL